MISGRKEERKLISGRKAIKVESGRALLKNNMMEATSDRAGSSRSRIEDRASNSPPQEAKRRRLDNDEKGKHRKRSRRTTSSCSKRIGSGNIKLASGSEEYDVINLVSDSEDSLLPTTSDTPTLAHDSNPWEIKGEDGVNIPLVVCQQTVSCGPTAEAQGQGGYNSDSDSERLYIDEDYVPPSSPLVDGEETSGRKGSEVEELNDSVEIVTISDTEDCESPESHELVMLTDSESVGMWCMGCNL